MVSSLSANRLSLSNDLVFKVLFSRQTHLLSDLINAVRHPMQPVTVVDVLNPHILPEELTGKNIVLDILARDDQGTLFIVEMQMRLYRHWAERNLYYLARGLSKQLQSGEEYQFLKPSISISLLTHDLFPEHPDKACWHFTLRDTEHADVQLGLALQAHIIELRKAGRLGNLPLELGAWIACLQHSSEDNVMSRITHPPVKEALCHLQSLYSDEELRLAAQRRRQAVIDDLDALDYARTTGLREGREQGREQGKATLLRQLATHRFGPLPIDVQQRLSGASPEQIDAWALNILDAQRLEDVFR